MSEQSGPAAVSRTAGSLQTGSADKHTQPRAALKYRRVLAALLARPSLNRFTAERDPEIRDHVLPSTVSELQKRGLRIDRRIVTVPGFAGEPAHVAEYSLPADQRDAALRLLERA